MYIVMQDRAVRWFWADDAAEGTADQVSVAISKEYSVIRDIIGQVTSTYLAQTACFQSRAWPRWR